MIMKLKFMSTGSYQKIIENQWNWFHTPCHEGDYFLKNFWLEDNLNVHIDLLRLRQKTLPVSLSAFVKQYDARKKQEADIMIFKNENILITK